MSKVYPKHNTKTIVYHSYKPGVGKSTAALLTCFSLAAQGERVMYVDADAKSQTGSEWCRSVKDDEGSLPFTRVNGATASMLYDILDAYDNHTWIIVDIKGGDTELIKLIAPYADMILMCTTMSPLDTDHLPDQAAALAVYRQAVKALLVGRVPRARANKLRKLCKTLNDRGINIMDSYLPQLVDYENVFKSNPYSVGFDMGPTDMLVKEIRDVFKPKPVEE